MTTLSEIEQNLASDDPEDRRQAAARLALETGEGFVPLLLQALGDQDWRVRKEATTSAVALAPSADVLDALVRVFAPGDNVGLRNAAVEALAGYGQAAVEAIGAAMPELDADGRKLAVEALGKSELASALPILKELLSDRDGNVRGAVVESVAAIAATCLEAAAPVLVLCLDTRDTLVRLAALDGLNRLGIVLGWQQIQPLLDDPVLERACLVALGRSGDVRAATLLARALERRRSGTWDVALRAIAEFVRASDAGRRAAHAAIRELSSSAKQYLLNEAAGAADDLELRRAALSLLGFLGSDIGAEVAVEALSDDRIAGAAEQALSYLGGAAVPALIERAATGASSERAVCVELLGRLDAPGSDDAIECARAALSDESLEVVSSALGTLARIGNEACLRASAEWVSTEASTGVRSAAVAALSALAQRHPSAAKRLAASVSAEGPDAQIAAVIAAALGVPVRGGLEEDAKFLAAALSNDSPHARRAALDAFAALGGAYGVESVVFALTDEEREVQLAAIRALGRMRAEDGSVPGLASLFELIERGGDEALIASAIHALGQAGDPRALPVLKPLVKSASPILAVAAIEALSSIADPRRLEALSAALGHADAEVVKAALRVLANEHDPRVSAHVCACLDHEAWDVRRLVADLVPQLDVDASQLLRAKLSIEPEPLVKDAMQRALVEVEGVASGRRSVPPPGGSFRPR